MPMPGGDSNKRGNIYESSWTVLHLIEVMSEQADSIKIEPVGFEGEGAEFWLKKDGFTEYHQVKRQNIQGSWTIALLADAGVLEHAKRKLADDRAKFVFASTLGEVQLTELAYRARGAESWDEFYHEFIKANSKRSQFTKLTAKWNISQQDTYKYLKRLYTETIAENLLSKFVQTRLESLVEGNPSTVESVLKTFIGESIHKELLSIDIWKHLQDKGFRRREWGKDPSVLAACEKNNERYFSRIRKESILGEAIPRDEAKEVVNRLKQSTSKKCLLISGRAGEGKSGVLLQVVEEMEKQSWPTIAFRVDQLENCLLPEKVGEQLGLPSSPVAVLVSIAKGRDCLLVIDQLDAVSLASGRNTDFFDKIQEIIDQSRAYPNMRVVLACRQFDLHNDHRFRALVGTDGLAEEVPINCLTHETVKQIVSRQGLDSNLLSLKQLDLLSVPLHLRLLTEIANDKENHVNVSILKTAHDLFDAFWKHKQKSVQEKVSASQWTQTIDLLCDYMSERQVLFAPESILDEYADVAETMASEHVLTIDNKKYSFFHEGFFDYCFARRFVAKKQCVVNVLLADEQHLFRRAQVRQILLSMRDADFDRYITELKKILKHPGLRFHIKQATVSFLGLVENPREEERDIVVTLLTEQAEALGKETWKMLGNSQSWILFLVESGIIKDWLADEQYAHIAVGLLIHVQQRIPKQLVELLEKYVNQSGEWNKRLFYLVRRSDASVDREFFDFILKMVKDGVFDEAWDIVHKLPEKQPEWACEYLGKCLHRQWELSLAKGEPNPFRDRSRGNGASQFILTCAQNSPRAYWENVFPFFSQVLEANAYKQDPLPQKDSCWSDISYPYNRDDNADIIFRGMEISLQELAKHEPDTCRQMVATLRESPYVAVQFLLIRGYTANGREFADEAIEYLCDQTYRFQTGYRGSTHWATRLLLEQVTPYCSDAMLSRLEEQVLNYYSEWEKSAESYRRGLRCRGYSQFTLLEGIVQERRSRQVTSKIQEWQRKFKRTPEEPSKVNIGGLIPSPIPTEKAAKMTDEQWLSAIADYRTDDKIIQNGELLGGAFQLSITLEEQAKKAPEHFANLLLQFPKYTHHYYFDAVLRALGNSTVSMDVLHKVCRQCHELPLRPCGSSIVYVIKAYADKIISTELLDLVSWYAIEDPESELCRTKANHGDSEYDNGDKLSAAIHSTSGQAADAIAHLINHSKGRVEYYRPVLEKMVQDSSIAVRCRVASALIALLRHDRDWAVELFLQLCHTEDVVLGTRYVEEFLNYTGRTHSEQLVEILVRMVRSDQESVVEAGSRQACLTSLVVESERYDQIVKDCLRGSESQRVGVAKVVSANVRHEEYRAKCETALKSLFHDPSEKVWKTVAKCWQDFKGKQLAQSTSLIESFVESPAFTFGIFHLLGALEVTEAKLPEVTLQVCERFISVSASEVNDYRTSTPLYTGKISQLIMRLYSQSQSKQEWQSKCLDLVDKMMELQADVDDAILAFER